MSRWREFLSIAFSNARPVIQRDQDKIRESSELHLRQRELAKRYSQSLDRIDAMFASVIHEKGNPNAGQ